MSTLLMCAVYDSAAGAFMQPFFVRTKAEAIRSFSDAVSDGNSVFCKHPEDYYLAVMGVFDDNSGVVAQANNEPLKLISANECVRVVEPQKVQYADLRDATVENVERLRKSS